MSLVSIMDPVSAVLVIGLGAGLANGAFVATVLAAAPRSSRATSGPLAAIVACLCLMVAEELLQRTGLITLVPHATGSTVALDYLVAPMLWVTARAATDQARRFERVDLVHLLPFAVASLVAAPFHLLPAADKMLAVERGLPGPMLALVLGKLALCSSYLAAAIVRLRGFRRTPGFDALSSPDRDTVVWLARSLLALAAVGVGMLVLGAASAAGYAVPIEGDALGGLFITASTFIISGFLIRHPDLRTGADEYSAGEGRRSPAKYATSPLDEARKRGALDQLLGVMERHRPYLDCELTLDRLARLVDLPPNHLSQVLNEAAGRNFYDFVNGYRVEAARRLLADPASIGRTVLSVAHEAGFNSKASFNRVFRRLTGMTPTEFAAARLSHRVERGDPAAVPAPSCARRSAPKTGRDGRNHDRERLNAGTAAGSRAGGRADRDGGADDGMRVRNWSRTPGRPEHPGPERRRNAHGDLRQADDTGTVSGHGLRSRIGSHHPGG